MCIDNYYYTNNQAPIKTTKEINVDMATPFNIG